MKQLLFSIIFSCFCLNAFAQVLPSKCFSKIVVKDSVSGKETPTVFNLNSPLPTLFIKDRFKCDCATTKYEFVLVRGQRPLLNPQSYSNDVLRLSNIKTLVEQSGNSLKEGDRFVITVIEAFIGTQKCRPMQNGASFTGEFKETGK